MDDHRLSFYELSVSTKGNLTQARNSLPLDKKKNAHFHAGRLETYGSHPEYPFPSQPSGAVASGEKG